MIRQSNLTKLFSLELQDMYDAERKELKTLSSLQENITSAELWAFVMRYMDIVKDNIETLESMFELLAIPSEGRKCYVVSDLLSEVESLMSSNESPEMKEAELMMNLQHIINYKMAAYSAASVYAMDLFHNELSMQLNNIRNRLESFHNDLEQLMALTITTGPEVQIQANLPVYISPNHITKLPMTVRQ